MNSNLFCEKLKESGYECTIINEDDNILFLAKDIGQILNIKNIRQSIIYYDKTTRISQTNGGPQKQIYLTFEGLKKLFFSASFCCGLILSSSNFIFTIFHMKFL